MHKNLVVADALVIEVNSDNEPIILENSAVLVQDGIIKEIWDKRIGSFISKRDLIADIAGILAAVFIVHEQFE